ncbi:MAG: hypothetical protein HC819_00595 [Cyclobacteriaceae bacterium]|nr:hypothetical protein [Cyclobacteriaceae bacterium]
MKRYVLLLIVELLVLWASPIAPATHIVGGEFEIRHIEGDRYLFRQIQYFDVVNGDARAKDLQVDASIFRKRDNVFVRSVTMRLQGESYVPYSNPVCTNDKLVTNRLIYSTEATLDPELFSDVEGYYMVWERCCRNNIINNILRPQETGQTFYIEFPPIRKDGEAYRNTTPRLFPPLSDYACVNRLYYVDFRGVDDDGDSLVYTLVTPFNTSVLAPLPVPSPAPHPLVTWIPGINSEYQIPGNPTLMIDNKGFLRVTPSEEGLFVFSVRCDEYRDGQKIGSVFRDFQLFVIDCPMPGTPPVISVKTPGTSVYSNATDTVRISAGDEKCLEFKVSDGDGSQSVKMRAVPVNFEQEVSSFFVNDVGVISQPTDSAVFQFCLPDCPVVPGMPAIIDIIAEDFTCPLPLMDTLRLVVVVEPPPNKAPKFTLPAQKTIEASYLEGTVVTVDFEATDADGDSLMLFAEGEGFELDDFGIEIDTTYYGEGKIRFQLNWDTNCSIYPFAIKNDFSIKLFVDDLDQCAVDNRDSIVLHVRIGLPENNLPIVLVDNSPVDRERTVRILDNISVEVQARDADQNDQLWLAAVGVGFDLRELGMTFADTSGKSNIKSQLTWKIGCDDVNIGQNDSYEILFIAEDADKCKVSNADTLRLVLLVDEPINSAPELLVNGQPAIDTIFIDAGNAVEISISGVDADGDLLRLTMADRTNLAELGVVFDDKSAVGLVESDFFWQTNCDLLSASYGRDVYTFVMVVADEKCLVSQSDSLHLVIVVGDEQIDYDFHPPNVFTPNPEDEINKSFYIPNLPGDNCSRQFQQVSIYNRWGKEVFSSKDRAFRWSGLNEPSGVYFYAISYTGFSIKGTVSILR